MEHSNFNNFTTDGLLQSDEDLSVYDIFNLIWRIICIVPNVTIPCIIIKQRLYHASNFYFVIFHWSLSNFVYILSLLYLEAVPEKHITLKCLEISYFLHDIVSSLFIMIVLMFIYNIYIDSKIVCKCSVYLFWVFYISAAVTIVTLVYSDLTNNKVWLYLSGTTRVLCFAVVTIEAVSFYSERTKNKPGLVRFIMAAIYIVSDFIEWILDILLSQNIYDVVIFEVASMIFYANGLINLILLICLDVNFKNSCRCVFKLFKCLEK